MKILVEIPDNTYDYWKTHKHELVIAEAISKGIVLPENPTNGDMALSLWNGIVKLISERQNLVVVKFGEKMRCFQLDWWNAAYKEHTDD